jgi:acylphosphatase
MYQLTVRYSGRVQGVGFRATVSDLASYYSVTGEVSNVHDGTVNLRAEGEQDELLRFRAAILESLNRYIVNYSDDWAEIAARSFSSFRIGSNQ